MPANCRCVRAFYAGEYWSILANLSAICTKPMSLRNTVAAKHVTASFDCAEDERFRVCPQGVAHGQQAASLKAHSPLLCVPGFGYQGMADLLESLLHPVSKTAACFVC
jgi:hypothetical protein